MLSRGIRGINLSRYAPTWLHFKRLYEVLQDLHNYYTRLQMKSATESKSLKKEKAGRIRRKNKRRTMKRRENHSEGKSKSSASLRWTVQLFGTFLLLLLLSSLLDISSLFSPRSRLFLLCIVSSPYSLV